MDRPRDGGRRALHDRDTRVRDRIIAELTGSRSLDAIL